MQRMIDSDIKLFRKNLEDNMRMGCSYSIRLKKPTNKIKEINREIKFLNAIELLANELLKAYNQFRTEFDIYDQKGKDMNRQNSHIFRTNTFLFVDSSPFLGFPYSRADFVRTTFYECVYYAMEDISPYGNIRFQLQVLDSNIRQLNPIIAAKANIMIRQADKLQEAMNKNLAMFDEIREKSKSASKDENKKPVAMPRKSCAPSLIINAVQYLSAKEFKQRLDTLQVIGNIDEFLDEDSNLN
ncbi:unnamed protein product [Brachionus calyciflorus]|uniref:Uncharacterized protein n=1 Tax=Brachionus calyciflorus TaxID=104777 RepID=A0A814LHW5_9BILA|nr:unnamed protein product [Brachionus calyciflorus]